MQILSAGDMRGINLLEVCANEVRREHDRCSF